MFCQHSNQRPFMTLPSIERNFKCVENMVKSIHSMSLCFGQINQCPWVIIIKCILVILVTMYTQCIIFCHCHDCGISSKWNWKGTKTVCCWSYILLLIDQQKHLLTFPECWLNIYQTSFAERTNYSKQVQITSCISLNSISVVTNSFNQYKQKEMSILLVFSV